MRAALCLAMGMGLTLGITSTYADGLTDFIRQTKVSGNLRAYYFNKDYSSRNFLTQYAYSLGGHLNILTPAILGGLQADLGFYTAQDLGLNSGEIRKQDRSLPAKSINAWAQAFLQYKTAKWLVRLGDQLLTTPWIASSDTRMIPASYRALFANVALTPNLSLTALRVFAYKSRIAEDFSRSNLYSPSNIAQAIPALGDTPVRGATAAGLNLQQKAVKSQIWAYQFYDFGKLVYADIDYAVTTPPVIKPLAGVQIVREWGDGSNLLQQYSTGKAHSSTFGVKTGVNWRDANLVIGYNWMARTQHAFNQGGIVAPYMANYISDPLYTTSMINGLVEKSPGHAIKISTTFHLFAKQLATTLSYARYFTKPITLNNTRETDVDVTYSFLQAKYLKGLSIRNRFGWLCGDASYGRLAYERLMLQYTFG